MKNVMITVSKLAILLLKYNKPFFSSLASAELFLTSSMNVRISRSPGYITNNRFVGADYNFRKISSIFSICFSLAIVCKKASGVRNGATQCCLSILLYFAIIF